MTEYLVSRVKKGVPSNRDIRLGRRTDYTINKSEWYPRIVEADNHEQAVERMFEEETGELRVAGLREFLVVPLDHARLVVARPRKEYTIESSPFPVAR